MATELRLPELGEGVEEGTVSQVLVREGDTIEAGQGIIELESEKAVAEIPSTVDGVVKELRVAEGQTVRVGDVIMLVDAAEDASEASAAEKPEKPAKAAATSGKSADSPPPPSDGSPAEDAEPEEDNAHNEAPGKGERLEFKLPELGEGVTEGTVSQVLVREGDTIEAGQGIIELESEKAVAEIPSTVGGTVAELRIEEGQTVHVGDVIAIIESSGAADTSKPPPKKTEKRPQLRVVEREDKPAESPAARKGETRDKEKTGGARAVLAAPSVRRVARELGVKLDEIPTSDPAGRVTVEDVRRFAQAEKDETATARQPAASARKAAASDGKWGAERREPMSQIRKKTAERMAANWSGIPHVTHHDLADITEIDAMRKKYGRKVEQAGGKLTVTAVLLKVVAEALRRFPKFNANVDTEAQEVVYKEYCNIGVAVDTPNGLLVPVVRDADRKSLTELCVSLPALAAKARDRKLAIEDMQGGTFTISNLGGIGGTAFTPIINGPEVAILGVSRSRIEPVHMNGQFAPRMMMPLSLSYDHRLIDGAEAARFTRFLAEALEQPWILFLDEA